MAELQRTPLYDLHRVAGAKMVEFADYSMPVSYPAGVKQEHLHTRAQAGLFDVSHMGQVTVSGPNATADLESLLPIDLDALSEGQCGYSLLLNEQGGIIDDLIITKLASDRYMLVVNASRKARDLAEISAHVSSDTVVTEWQSKALLALQGPAAVEVLASLGGDLSELPFMHATSVILDGIECLSTRSGYTGEDGFELSVEADRSAELAERLLGEEPVKWAGLGARDSLRLEAGLCLYGHDLDETIDPLSAGLSWAVARTRREGASKAGGFRGAEALFALAKQGLSKRRVGLRIEGRAPVREGAQLVDAQGNDVGVVTSGGFSPSLGAPVAMGYVAAELAVAGVEINAMVRGKALPVTVCALPFVPHQYYRG